MKPKERMKAFWEGRDIDRIPCVPLFGTGAVTSTKITVRDYYKGGVLMAKAQIASFGKYKFDSVELGAPCAAFAEAMGAKVFYPEYDVPWIEEPLVKDREDLRKLRPTNPKKDGKFPEFLEALKIIIDEIGDEVDVSCGLMAPFTLAQELRGAKQICKDIYEDPELVHELLSVCLESCLRSIDAVKKIGGTTGLGDPSASGSIISPLQYKEFALPYTKKAADRINKYGEKLSLHICGETRDRWELMADSGADLLSLDSVVDLEEAKKKVGDRVVLMGNVRSVSTLLKGTPQEVELEVKQCIRKAFDNPRGYVVSSGCDTPINTPSENLLAMINAVRKYGKYPLDMEVLFGNNNAQ